MKEATGELNMTVITIVAIAAIAAFFYAFVWPAIRRSIVLNQACAAGPGTQDENFTCTNVASGTDGTFSCTLRGDIGNQTKQCAARE